MRLKEFIPEPLTKKQKDELIREMKTNPEYDTGRSGNLVIIRDHESQQLEIYTVSKTEIMML